MAQQDSENQTSPVPVNQTSPAGAITPIQPEQLWNCLSPQQQQGVFQILVGVCQEFLHRQTQGGLEAADELR